MIKSLNNLLQRKYILDFYENPGEFLDEVNGIKAYRYLHYADTEDTYGIMNSADFSDGDEPDDGTEGYDFDVYDEMVIEDTENMEEYDDFDIESLEIILNQLVNTLDK